MATFGYLRFFGSPYNHRDPGMLQAVLHLLMMTVHLFDVASYFFRTKEDHGWVNYIVVMVIVLSQNTISVFCLVMTLRKDHPVVAITSNLEKQFPQTASSENHNTWLNVGFALVFINFLCKIHDYSVKTVLEEYSSGYLSNIVGYLYLAQFVTPMHSLAQKTSRLKTTLRSYRGREDPFLAGDTWKLVLRQRRLAHLVTDLVQEFYYHVMLIAFGCFYHCTVACYFLIGKYIGFIPNVSSVSDVKIFSAAHHFTSAVSVFYKMQNFFSELYTLCMEDNTGTLLQHKMMNVFLDHRQSGELRTHTFFPLDHSLTHFMLSKAVTWLFIIIQFRIQNSSVEDFIHK